MFKKRAQIRKRGFIMGDALGWWILAIAVAVGMFIFFFVLQGKGTSLIELFKNMVRFGK